MKAVTPKHSWEHRLCFVCGEAVPEFQGVRDGWLRIVYHRYDCERTVRAALWTSDPLKRARRALRSPGAVLRRIARTRHIGRR